MRSVGPGGDSVRGGGLLSSCDIFAGEGSSMLRGAVGAPTIAVMSVPCSPGPGSVGGAGQSAAPAERPWTTLFDGSSLDGWATTGDANWRVADGVVSADSGAGFLVTQTSHADFELKLEFF